MTRGRRPRLVRAAIGASLVVLAAAAAPPGRSTGFGAQPCTPGRLVVWLDTGGSGALGSLYYRLELTNLSERTCTLFGYPGVSAVGLSGRQLGSAATRDRSSRPRLVRLAPGHTAAAVLQVVSAGNFPRAGCRPVTAAGLRVYPPGATKAKLVPFPFRACSRAGPGFLLVRPVR